MRTRPLYALVLFAFAACGGQHNIGGLGQENRIGKPCGGIAGAGCGPNQICADDPTDACDPQKGGADCAGVCQCSPVVCALYCEHGFARDAAGCATCRCNDPSPNPGGPRCGPTTCAAGEECCNASCGICVKPGGACTQQACEPSCPPVACALACPNGFQKGPDGCEICHCEPARTPVNAHCIRSTNDACQTDADCTAGGCGGELCYNPALGGGVSTCDCGPPSQVGCGCVAGRCTWYK